MHSRIFQISTQPIHICDYIEESKYYDTWFTNSYADYVDGDTNRTEDIQWLKECYEGKGLTFGADDNGEYFIIEDKVKYFLSSFEEFQKTLKELSEVALDDFITHKAGLKVGQLNTAYQDTCGFYVDDLDYGLCSLDYFIRSNVNGTKYYIGATIDYHF